MNEPLLSIVIVSYENPSLVLRRAIQSIRNQSYRNYEIILVDANQEGSKYSLGLREDMEAYDDIFVIECPSKRGEFAAAKNQGASQANGTYLAFLMGHDAWNQECAASQIEILEERSNVALVFCSSWIGTEDAFSVEYKNMPYNESQKRILEQDDLEESIHSVSQVMFRRECFEELCGFDPKIHRQDDYDMWVRLSKKYKIAALEQNLVCSYLEANTLRKSKKLIDVVGFLQIYSKHSEMYKKNPIARLELYRKIAECYKQSNYFLSWLKYVGKVKFLEIKTGKKAPEKRKKSSDSNQQASPMEYNVVNQTDKEYIMIVKYKTDNFSQISLPEAGAEFCVFLKNSGGYEYARVHERDKIITNDEGWAKTRPLSQGTYVVCQINTSEKSEEVEIVLGRNGKTHVLSFGDTKQKSLVKIISKDSETGKLITCGGSAYKIYNNSGTSVTMLSTYPEIRQIDTFFTGDKGYLFTPEKLCCGEYFVRCIEAPFGYNLNDAKIPFKISKENETEEDGNSVVVVTTESKPQKGRIFIQKSGTVLFSADKTNKGEKVLKNKKLFNGDFYEITYKEDWISGTIFEIVAEEDINFFDGEVRITSGTIVDTVVTDEKGNACSKELFLGKYIVREKNASYGMVINNHVQQAELLYTKEKNEAGKGILFEGTHQKAAVYVKKSLEENLKFGIRSNQEFGDFAFGLFAMNDIILSEFCVIPKDSLLDILQFDQNGVAKSNCELTFGKYYVKELEHSNSYRASMDIYPIEFSYQGQDIEVVQIYVNDGKYIKSELIKGNIRGMVISSHNQLLAMARIGLFPIDVCEFTEKTALLEITTDWGGNFSFNEVPCGDYIIREFEAPNGYMLNETVYFVSLTYDQQQIRLKIINNPVNKQW